MINISHTAKKHQTIVPHLLAAHAISGCDTTALMYGIGKATTIKILGKGYSLSKVGACDAHMDDVIEQATKFIAACYGSKVEAYTNMSEVHCEIWIMKTGKKKTDCYPNIKTSSSNYCSIH